MIEAKIIKDSYNPDSKSRLTTFELTYPRFIHGELMTHRMFSRNAASSRAIPIDKVIELLQTNPAMPVHWGKNQTGMQANTEIDNIEGAKQLWLAARDSAINHAIVMRDMGLHKQIVNRVLEPFQLIKTIVTATEYNNWFWLRDHADAQPEIKELAQKMNEAYNESAKFGLVELLEDEWHVPYVNTQRSITDGTLFYLDENDNYITLEEARIISASCCAQVSYRKNDGSLEKAQVVFDRLINSVPVHASPVEHIATPIVNNEEFSIEGITHLDNRGQLWSGNLRGWVQYRQLIPNNVKKG